MENKLRKQDVFIVILNDEDFLENLINMLHSAGEKTAPKDLVSFISKSVVRFDSLHLQKFNFDENDLRWTPVALKDILFKKTSVDIFQLQDILLEEKKLTPESSRFIDLMNDAFKKAVPELKTISPLGDDFFKLPKQGYPIQLPGHSDVVSSTKWNLSQIQNEHLIEPGIAISDLVSRINSRKEEIIKQKLSEKGIDVEIFPLKRKRFNPILMECIQGFGDAIYYNDGSANGLFIVGFKISDGFFDTGSREFSVTHDIHVIHEEEEWMKIK